MPGNMTPEGICCLPCEGSSSQMSLHPNLTLAPPSLDLHASNFRVHCRTLWEDHTTWQVALDNQPELGRSMREGTRGRSRPARRR